MGGKRERAWRVFSAHSRRLVLFKAEKEVSGEGRGDLVSEGDRSHEEKCFKCPGALRRKERP